MTWYHLVSHIAGHPQQKHVIANQSADWRGNLPRQSHGCALKRDNGRTRGCLPVDTPAPRPCSAPSVVPAHTLPGSLTASEAYSSLHRFFQIYVAIIQANRWVCQPSNCSLTYSSHRTELAYPFGRGAPKGRRGYKNTLSVTPTACQLSQGESQGRRKRQCDKLQYISTGAPGRPLQMSFQKKTENVSG